MTAEAMIKVWAAKAVYAENAEDYRILEVEPFTAEDVDSVEFVYEEYGEAVSYAAVKLVDSPQVHVVGVPRPEDVEVLMQLILEANDAGL